MEFFAFLGLGAAVLGFQFFEDLLGKVEIFNNIWTFVNYHNRIDEYRQTLERKWESLCSVEEDVNTTLETAELNPGKKRKREVENWLRSVQRKKSDLQSMKTQIGDKKYSLGPWWESRLKKSVDEVEDLYQQHGKFECLLFDEQETSEKEFLTTTLVGQNSDGVLGRIWACLRNDQLLRIGVYGVEGVGKTAILMHIYNQLVKDATSGNVYWVTVSDDFSIHKLQSDIAKEVGLDLFDEEDTRKRAAKLHKGISTGKKCVLILDGLSRYFQQDEVGIPTIVGGCKLIVSTRSLRLCQRMGCHETIEIEPLPVGAAENLFMEKIGLSNPIAPMVEEIVKQIIEECGGLPLNIVTIAESMRGVDDINEWRYTLNELRGSKGVPQGPPILEQL